MACVRWAQSRSNWPSWKDWMRTRAQSAADSMYWLREQHRELGYRACPSRDRRFESVRARLLGTRAGAPPRQRAALAVVLGRIRGRAQSISGATTTPARGAFGRAI